MLLATAWIGIERLGAWLDAHPVSTALLGLGILCLIALIALLLVRRILLSVLTAVIKRSSTAWDDILLQEHLFHRVIWALPVVIVHRGLGFVPNLPPELVSFLQRLAVAALVVIAVRTLSALLAGTNRIYGRYPMSRHRPIKGYIQVVLIIVHVIGLVFMVALLIDRSPWYFLSGLGAMMAVILLVFRDTLLSLVAGIQLTTNDLIRVGDWIEMPQFGADGDVVDIALHTVKVQNWDRTFTVIPTHTFLEHSFKNWRGMSESGGRRIKRAIHVDVESIRFLTEEEIERFGRFRLLKAYFKNKLAEIADYNRSQGSGFESDVAARRLTNIGTFRAYIESYLRNHPKIHQQMTLMVRQLEPSSAGLPIEVYGFTNDTAWVRYEGIQSDIFDHLLAVAPSFGLRVYQQPSGADIRHALSPDSDAAESCP